MIYEIYVRLSSSWIDNT